MTTVDGASTAFTGNEVMYVLGFNFVAAKVATNCIFDNHWLLPLFN